MYPIVVINKERLSRFKNKEGITRLVKEFEFVQAFRDSFRGTDEWRTCFK